MRYNPEYERAMGPVLSAPKPAPHKTVLDLRAHLNKACSAAFSTLPRCPSVTETHLSVTSADGASVPLTRFTPEAVCGLELQPAVLYIRAGGMVAGSVELVKPSAAMIAEKTGVSFFAVGYRLAPEHPAPAAVEDSYAALEYMVSHAAELGLDASRIGVHGISGGGAPAAGVALMARDRGLSPGIAKLSLVYPMLDDRTRLGAEEPLSRYLVWSGHDNELAWRAVLGDGTGREDGGVSPYMAPGRMHDLTGLPPTYVDCGGLDLFLKESTAFVARLVEAGVEVEFHVWPGVPHMFEFSGISLSKRAVEARVAAIRGL